MEINAKDASGALPPPAVHNGTDILQVTAAERAKPKDRDPVEHTIQKAHCQADTPSVRSSDMDIGQLAAAQRTLVLLIPLFYNPGDDGTREPVEREKIERTEIEIRDVFSGYTRTLVAGWYRDGSTGAEFEDILLRYDIDAVFDAARLSFLRQWKPRLESRFRQISMYGKFSSPVMSL